MMNYKEFKKIYIGSSDIAALTLSSGKGVFRLCFQEDGDYYAYLVTEPAEIGTHYHLEWECETWLKIFDDEGLVKTIKAYKMKIYRAAMRGCIIECEGFESCDLAVY